MAICLERGADCLHMVQLMPLHPETPSSLASFISRLVLPFCYQHTQVVLEKRPLNGCSVVAVMSKEIGWSKVLLPTFRCLFKLAHMNHGVDATALLTTYY